MLQASEKIWMDGRFVNWADANVHILTHSLHYGLAAFEGIRCYKGKSGSSIFRLSEHVDRLFESAHIAEIRIPYDKKDITAAIIETVRVNRLDACYIRPLVYIGYGAMGLYQERILSKLGSQRGIGAPIWGMTRWPRAFEPRCRLSPGITSMCP